jgi:Kef-type K+ transport system membrane component KefB
MARYQAAKEGQLLAMLLIVAIAAIGAEAIHLEGIIGAFLAGLAVNRAIQHTQAKDELEMLGNTLFAGGGAGGVRGEEFGHQPPDR